MRTFLFTLLIILSLFSCKKNVETDTSDEPPIIDSTLNNAVIVCDGNSITWGQTWGIPYPEQLQETYPFRINGAKIFNKGVSGEQTSEMIVKAPIDIDTLYNASVRSISIAWEMSNDLASNGDVNGSVERMKIYCEGRKAKGWQVIVIGVLPRIQGASFDDAAGLQKKIDAANSILRVKWSEFADGFIDVKSDKRLMDASDTNYFVDGIHLNTTGMNVIKNLVIKELKVLK